MSRLLCAFVLAAAAAAASAPSTSSGQGYPSKPLRLVVPYAPGGVVDFIGRTLAQRLSEHLGQSVIGDNRPGAGGIIGVEATAKSAPDGYTLVLMDPAIVINPVLQDAVPYDVIRDLTAVSIVGSSPLVLVSNPALPVKNLTELIEYAKAHPGKLNFASAGIGTTPHMAGELMKLRIGAQMTHVPYKGMGPAMADVVAGRVQFSFGSITSALPFLKDNRIRGLATTGAKRSGALPDLPTMIEAGAGSGLSGFEVELWLGLFGPAGLPRDVLARLNAETKKAIEDPQARAAFAKVGVEPRGTSAGDAADFIRAENEKWGKVVRDAKLKGAG
ncbi:MAG TPA: tripartite tricarboxylate transporter substrate binding protein [Burkholderiales bacterium]